jgi:flagella basal body P-ring formation protein FlgA
MITTLILAAGVTVTLPMETEVRGTELTIGRIATVTGDDPDEVALVEAVRLGYVPAPGYSRLLQGWQLTQELSRQAPDVEAVFAGQPAVRVRPVVECISAASLLEVARVHLDELTAGADAVATPSGELADFDVPAGLESALLRVRETPGATPALRAGAISVPVEVWVDGAPYRTAWTSFELAVWETVPVLVRDVAAGSAIAPRDLEARRVEVGAAGSGKPLAGELLLGAVAARDLAAGSVVTATDVHRPQLVSVGDDLHLEIRSGHVTARVSVTAREAGAVGDRVRVEVSGDGRVLSAVVRSRELVVLDLNG